MAIYEISDNRIKWHLWEYLSPMGRGGLTSWREGLSTVRKADLDTFLRMMGKLEGWGYPHIKPLHGKPLKGLHELRWKSQGVPHRIGGYFASTNEFVMLIGCTHNAKKYDPPDALSETILVRKKQLQNREASLREYKVLTGR